MTETSILSGAVPSSDAGIDMVPPGTGGDDSDGDNRRRLLILGAIAGVLVLAAAAYLLLHKSSSNTPTAASPVPATGTVSAPAHNPPGKPPGKAGNNGKSTSLPKVAKQATPRDPFKALVTAPVQTSGGPSSTTKVSAAPSTAPTTVPVVTQPTTAPTSPTSGQSAGTPLWIQLTKTHGQSATFKVGYSHHKFRLFNVQAPKPTSSTGTVFGKIFALIGVQDGDATLQIGDGTPFDLTKGVSHVV